MGMIFALVGNPQDCPSEPRLTGTMQLEQGMAKLLAGSTRQDVGWHGWRLLHDAKHQVIVPLMVHLDRPWIRKIGTIRLVADWRRLLNPLSKDMYASKSSRLDMLDFSPSGMSSARWSATSAIATIGRWVMGTPRRAMTPRTDGGMMVGRAQKDLA